VDHENWPASISLVHVVDLETVKVEESLGKRIILEVRPTLTYHSKLALAHQNLVVGDEADPATNIGVLSPRS